MTKGTHIMNSGDIFDTNKFGKVEVMDSPIGRFATVRFLDTGYEAAFYKHHIRSGGIVDHYAVMKEKVADSHLLDCLITGNEDSLQNKLKIKINDMRDEIVKKDRFIANAKVVVDKLRKENASLKEVSTAADSVVSGCGDVIQKKMELNDKVASTWDQISVTLTEGDLRLINERNDALYELNQLKKELHKANTMLMYFRTKKIGEFNENVE